ncbi:MAG: ATP-binding cassette domain-containing protein, partial [Spirochaetales bacterium]|nr:ATP-binding cassette domain-containing protein [Spirochaetales bacterium]
MPEAGKSSYISMTGISKTYLSNGVKACSEVCLEVEPQTIHMVVGENGAGKSTLMKILSGDIPPDAGSITYKRKEVSWRQSRQALEAGIGMIHQILHYFPTLTVREHLILDMPDIPVLGRINKQTADSKISDICKAYQINCNPDEKVENLSSEARQTAALMALISRGTDVFILDEPPQTLLKAAVKLKEKGKTIIVITHNMQDALTYGDSVTVMRRGKHTGTYASADLTPDKLSERIMGNHESELTKRASRSVAGSLQKVIQLQGVTGGRPGTVDWIEDVNLSVHAGETVAVVGIRDNGLRALEALTAGYSSSGYKLIDGSVSILGKPPECCQPSMLGYIPSDRLEVGSSVGMSVTENLMIHDRNNPELFLNPLSPARRFAVYSIKSLEKLTRRAINIFSIQGKPSHPLVTLSGGNIQKLITARALLHSPKALICA